LCESGRMQIALLPFCILISLFLIGGCARAPLKTGELNPRILYEEACGNSSPGAHSESLTGSVWLKAHSKEASGQFPAAVEVKRTGAVRMEITNLVGGVEAVIRVEGNKYTIEMPKEKRQAQRQEGNSSWGGIPLTWATRLFLGRVPCPPESAVAEMISELTPEGELKIQTQSSLEREAELFVYRFRNSEGRPWPEALHWERQGVAPLSVDFKFDSPEPGTRSPRKWEAKSPQGEVKVRWREREVFERS